MYYAGTYALIEILRGNPDYKRYPNIVTGWSSLLELSQVLVRDLGEEKAREVLDTIINSIPVITPSTKDLVEAGKIMTGHRNLSIQDALGYAIALNRGLKYLTGDRIFKDMDNVEWVE